MEIHVYSVFLSFLANLLLFLSSSDSFYILAVCLMYHFFNVVLTWPDGISINVFTYKFIVKIDPHEIWNIHYCHWIFPFTTQIFLCWCHRGILPFDINKSRPVVTYLLEGYIIWILKIFFCLREFKGTYGSWWVWHSICCRCYGCLQEVKQECLLLKNRLNTLFMVGEDCSFTRDLFLLSVLSQRT